MGLLGGTPTLFATTAELIGCVLSAATEPLVELLGCPPVVGVLSHVAVDLQLANLSRNGTIFSRKTHPPQLLLTILLPRPVWVSPTRIPSEDLLVVTASTSLPHVLSEVGVRPAGEGKLLVVVTTSPIVLQHVVCLFDFEEALARGTARVR